MLDCGLRPHLPWAESLPKTWCLEMRGLQRIQITFQDCHNKGGKWKWNENCENDEHSFTQLFKGQSEAHFAQVQTEIVQTDEGRPGHNLGKDMGWRKANTHGWVERLLLKDSRSFRVSAQGVSAKETAKIPKSHEEMDPGKVNSCFVTKENRGKTQVAFLTLFVCFITI